MPVAIGGPVKRTPMGTSRVHSDRFVLGALLVRKVDVSAGWLLVGVAAPSPWLQYGTL